MHCANLVIISLTLTLIYFAWSDAHCFPAKGMSKSEANFIVAEHNRYRLIIANGKLTGKPKASNMKRMKWDGQLEKEAQRVAGYCRHMLYKVFDTRFPVGQLNYISKSNVGNNKAPNWTAAIETWWEGHNKITDLKQDSNSFTQIVWANTYLIGCGFRFFLNKDNDYEKRYYCNYAPPGNWNGELPYEVGEGCENLC